MTGPFSIWRARRFARAIDPGPRALAQDDSRLDEETRRLVGLTDRLRTADFNGAPSAEFRARLRTQLVTLAEAQPSTAPTPAPRHGVRRLAPDRAVRPRTRLVLLAGTMSALVVFSGLTVVVSDHSLPGDTLYSLKRTTEGVELALARGDQARAERHLDFAQTRAREFADLVRRNATEVTDAPTPPVSVTGGGGEPTNTGRTEAEDLVGATLGDMDQQTITGVRTLTEFAVTSVTDDPLAYLTSWVADQRAILGPALERLHGDASQRASHSVALLDRVQDRVVALRSQLTCACMDRGHGDDLGPLPCWPCDPPTVPRPTADSPPPTSQTGPGARQGPTRPASSTGAPGSASDQAPTGTSGGTSLPATSPPADDPSSLPSLTDEPTDGGLLPPILPTGVLPPLLPGLLPGLLGG